MLRKPVILLLAFLISTLAIAEGDPNKRNTRAEYIAQWKDVAIDQMEKHGIPASITLAQAILESGDGNSELARKANNHFGIKCHDWQGKKTYHDDDKRNECFRKYRNAQESFDDHSVFLQRSRYLFLFDYKVTDYKSWAKGLKKAGYATNPKYPDLLIRLIEENNLAQYDRPGAKRGKPPVKQRTTNGSNDAIVIEIQRGLEIQQSSNRIKYVIADGRYSPEALADRMQMGPWQIKKYNDLGDNEKIEEGQLVYLQPKRGKNRDHDTHTVKEGETLRGISQQYGVKIKKILKHSELPKDYRIKTGDELKLN
ncbi:MAG TPA: glucosaminidase domain-containing protein [Cryomorphaceae bacterium]|nr:glucosaminidase domain-containing protein [Cryomorphaceae bacterium]HKL40139.1 glucosaminidase domain-containing protein [Cryomorphaceae bacterium]